MKKLLRYLFSFIGCCTLGLVGAFIVCFIYLKVQDAHARHQAEAFCGLILPGMDSNRLQHLIQTVKEKADFTSFDASSGASAEWAVLMDERWSCDVTINEQGEVTAKQVSPR